MLRLMIVGVLLFCVCAYLTDGVYDGRRSKTPDARVGLDRVSARRSRPHRQDMERARHAPRNRRPHASRSLRIRTTDKNLEESDKQRSEIIDERGESRNQKRKHQESHAQVQSSRVTFDAHPDRRILGIVDADGDIRAPAERKEQKSIERSVNGEKTDHTDNGKIGRLFNLGRKPDLKRIFQWPRSTLLNKTYWQGSISHLLTPITEGSASLGEGIGLEWNVGVMVDNIGNEWWTGPNVCKVREESEEDVEVEGGDDISRHYVFSSTFCDQTHTAYTCTTKTGILGKVKIQKVSFQCCHGYQRRTNEPGCTEGLELTDLSSTLQQLQVTAFVRALNSLGLTDELAHDNYTIFAPTNNASEQFMEDKMNLDVTMITPELVEMGRQVEAILGAHVVHGFHTTAQTRDEQLLSTAHPQAKIRLNFYDTPSRLVTANCQPLVSSDNLATNGVVHVVDGLLMPVTDSITDIISKSPELSTLKTIIGKTGMASLLQQEGQFTMFAPTNDAFTLLDVDTLSQLLENTHCVSSVVNHHLLPNVICSSVITRRARAINKLGKYLVLDQPELDRFTVGDAQFTQRDIMATNGVIHLIDKVLVPDEALDILQLASRAGATRMVELIEMTGMSKIIRTAGNITLFLPTNEAIENVPFNMTVDPETLSSIVKYHVLELPLSGRQLQNDHRLETMYDESVLIKEYSSHLFGRDYAKTAQCSPLVHNDIESCHGVAHIVDKVLLPPGGDLVDVLYQHEEFTTLVGLLKKSGAFVEELQRADGLTLFAPTNTAFRNMRQDDIARLEENPDEFQKFLQHHLISDVLCCAGIFETQWLMGSNEHTLGGSTLRMQRDGTRVTVGGVPIASCDITATNGVVHAVDQPVVLPSRNGHGERRGHSWQNLRDILNVRELKWQDVFDLDLDVDWDFNWNRRK